MTQHIHGQVHERLDHSAEVVGATKVVASHMYHYGVITTQYMLQNQRPSVKAAGRPGSSAEVCIDVIRATEVVTAHVNYMC